MEGRVPTSTSDTMYQHFEEGKIYHIRYFNLLPNNQRYRLTDQPYIINIKETTTITLIQENIPPIPSYIFHPQRYTQLFSSASETGFLTDVVGRICLIQGSDLYNHYTDSKIIIGLRLDRSKLVRLTLWDKEASNFRELNGISTRKNHVAIITSIIPRIHEGKLSLTATPGTRFYFNNEIEIIQRFQKRNKLLS
ncbi:hypothetical protein IGI04_032141 [Brassica rapa subsp. trilocularis]|uniref:DUF223 domain-containing protein n=1 Tax=Brassica rapa subsp. trilocularis TaxID=1813537 RepID=A0ABQ7LVN2_BRACM|nr:hypothetical protein IGI04_032141 [Brassica rapa subsp. trilocularis]